MIRFLFGQIFWSLSKYVLRNPYARRAATQGCLALLLIGVAVTLVSVILSVIAGILEWATTTPDTAIVLLAICVAVIAGVTAFIVARPTRRNRISGSLRTTRARFGRNSATPQDGIITTATLALPSPKDLDKVRILDDAECPGTASESFNRTIEIDGDLLDHIVINGEE